MFYKIIFYIAIIFLSGCASMSNGSHQNITIATTNNDFYESTRCNISNEEGEWSVAPDVAASIHRDGNIMNISCQNKLQSGIASVEPKFEGEFLFLDLLLDLCIISCIVDGVNNAFYEYPSFISVHMKAEE